MNNKITTIDPQYALGVSNIKAKVGVCGGLDIDKPVSVRWEKEVPGRIVHVRMPYIVTDTGFQLCVHDTVTGRSSDLGLGNCKDYSCVFRRYSSEVAFWVTGWQNLHLWVRVIGLDSKFKKCWATTRRMQSFKKEDLSAWFFGPGKKVFALVMIRGVLRLCSFDLGILKQTAQKITSKINDGSDFLLKDARYVYTNIFEKDGESRLGKAVREGTKAVVEGLCDLQGVQSLYFDGWRRALNVATPCEMMQGSVCSLSPFSYTKVVTVNFDEQEDTSLINYISLKARRVDKNGGFKLPGRVLNMQVTSDRKYLSIVQKKFQKDDHCFSISVADLNGKVVGTCDLPFSGNVQINVQIAECRFAEKGFLALVCVNEKMKVGKSSGLQQVFIVEIGEQPKSVLKNTVIKIFERAVSLDPKGCFPPLSAQWNDNRIWVVKGERVVEGSEKSKGNVQEISLTDVLSNRVESK
ncbi:MAG: hypothetical protein JW725_04375 [Candidatus Babeliaceae bacterium]|nr:hypothetical protein [Candidatus Babeliaceae bacterium]